MKRVIVIGCPGSGKSCFARALQKKTGLPVSHLDLLYWNSDRTVVPREMFLERLYAVMGQPCWIIDGNYASTMEARLAACDTVFFLDYSTDICLSGIRERRGKVREDLPWVEETEDEEFMTFVRGYRTEGREHVLALQEKYPQKNWIVFSDRAEADRYLEGL